MPKAITDAFDAGVFSVAEPSKSGSSMLAPQTVQSVWVVPVILVDFVDQPLTWSASTFDSALFDTTGSTPTGSVFDYYRWVSGNRARITGRVVATVHLPREKNWYAFDFWGVNFHSTPRNAAGLVHDALTACESRVDWRPFDQDRDGYVDVVWVLHSGFGGEISLAATDNMWSITSRLTNWSSSNYHTSNDTIPGTTPVQVMRVNNFSILPERSMFRQSNPCEIGVFCHEFGHSLGLPDLYDASSLGGAANKGPGNWSLMATGIYGGNGYQPEYPAHMGAWPALYLGWANSVRPDRDSTFLLPPLAAGGQVVELSFQGEPRNEHFLIENRQQLGFDRNIPGEGLIVYQVDDGLIAARLASNRVNSGTPPGLRLVEADGRNDLMLGLSRGDSWDIFPGTGQVRTMDDDTSPSTRTYSGSPTNTAIRNITPIGDTVRFDAQVRAAGWRPPADVTGGPYLPVAATGPGRRAALLQDMTAVVVGSENVGGVPQVVFRARNPDRTWGAPSTISASPTGAVEPTVVALPGGDVGVVWSDTRHGPHELYFRSRIRGTWTPERRLTDLPGPCRAPAASADSRGGVHVAWHYNGPIGAQIMFMYFPYTSPFGMARAVTDTSNVPDLPAVAAAPDGASYVLWPEYKTGVPRVWFSRFHPDSGFRSRQRLSPAGGQSETAVNAFVDLQGGLHSVWTSFGTVSELRYQLRQGAAPPIPRDTLLEARAETIQNPAVAVDFLGAAHIVFEASAGGTPQLFYKHREPDRGWDAGATQVVTIADGGGVRPAILAEHPRVVSILYTAFPAGEAHLYERAREIVIPGTPTAVDEAPAPPTAAPGVRAGPNPLRAGQTLLFRLADPGRSGERLEVFDLAGRLVASTRIVAAESGSAARFEPSVTGLWSAGVYLARRSGSRGPATRFVVLR